MPSPSTTAFPIPKSWDEFEEIVADVLRLRWNTPHVTRNGRSGQAQNGIDIYARGAHLAGSYVGAQCKRVDEMSTNDIDAIILEAAGFEPALAELLITTTLSRDAKLQEHVRKLNVRRAKSNKFPAEILFWEDICLDLAGDKRLLAKHFPGWSKLTNDEREPEFAVRWLIEDVPCDEATIVGLPDDLVDPLTAIDPYTDEEIEYLERTHAADAEKAKEFNARAHALAADPDFRRRWREWNQWTAHHDGAKLGIAISLEHAPAKDVLIKLDFGDEIDVFRADARIGTDEDGETPLPEHPKLESEREPPRLNLFGKGGVLGLGSSLLMGRPALDVGWFRDPTIRARDGRVKIELDEFSPRRTVSYADEDTSIVVGAWLRAGTRTVKWTADAANRSSTQAGELRLTIVPNKTTLERRRKTRIGEQPKFSFSLAKRDSTVTVDDISADASGDDTE